MVKERPCQTIGMLLYKPVTSLIKTIGVCIIRGVKLFALQDSLFILSKVIEFMIGILVEPTTQQSTYIQ